MTTQSTTNDDPNKKLINEIKDFKIKSNDPNTLEQIKKFKSANTSALNTANKFSGDSNREASIATSKVNRKIDNAQNKLRAYDLTRDELDSASNLANKVRAVVRETFEAKSESNINKSCECFIKNQAKKVEERIKNQLVGQASDITSSDREILRKAREINERSSS